MSVILIDSNVVDTATVFLKGSLHNLSLSSNSPHADFSFHATRYDSLAVVSWGNSGDSVVMGIVNGVKKLT